MERVTVLDADRRDVVIAERARGSRPFLALSPQRDSNNHLWFYFFIFTENLQDWRCFAVFFDTF